MTSATTTEPGALTERPALTERHGNVLLVTINRPAARNAVNAAVSEAVGGALELAEDDPEIRVVVLTGAGDKSFCAGADLKALSRGENTYAPGHAEWGFAGFVKHYISKPVIAAVNGTALGGGTELALAADLVVAAESASFGLPEVKRGLIAGAGGAFRLPAQIPQRLAMEMMLTGDPISAATAKEYRLINDVVPDAELLDAALTLAERISVNAPLAVQASKRVALGVDDGEITSERSKWARSEAQWRTLLTSEDAKEGPLAFAEKRAPVWKSR